MVDCLVYSNIVFMEGGGNAEILTMIFSDDMTYMVYNVNVKLRLSRIFYVSLHVMK